MIVMYMNSAQNWDKCIKLMNKYSKFIPNVEKSDTLKGELACAINRVVYRYFNDGDKAGEAYGKETVNACVRFINAHLKTDPGSLLQICVDSGFCMFNDDKYEEILVNLCEIASEVLENGDYDVANEENMYDYRADDDCWDGCPYDYDPWEDDWEDC